MMDYFLGDCVVDGYIDEAKPTLLSKTEILFGAFFVSSRIRKTARSWRGAERNGYLLITDKRILFWCQSLLTEPICEFLYEDIRGVEGSRGIFMGKIQLNTQGSIETFKNVFQNEVDFIANKISEMIDKTRQISSLDAAIKSAHTNVDHSKVYT